MFTPDYTNSIVNLTSSISKAFGVEQGGYSSLANLADMDPGNQPLVLLIVDGLGASFLSKFEDSFLFRRLKRRLTSVFPSTTASAITSLFTGVGPQQHAITGWFTYFKEMGTVATVLPFTPRYGGESFTAADITPAQLIDHAPLVNCLSVPCHAILPNYILDSAYSRAISERALRHGYSTLAGMFEVIEKTGGANQPCFITAYWAELDSLAHSYGISSPEVEEHFLELDARCENLFSFLAERGVKTIITADHGLIDTDREHTVYLEDHPELAATLTLPLCGEPRCAYCYVRSDKKEQFESYVTTQLDCVCELKKSSDLISQGFFGLGQPSVRLAERVGEYALLMKENYIIKDRLINEKKFRMRGVHGGFSEQEMYVPLITFGI